MIDFTEVENAVRSLKQQLAEGKIDEKEFEDLLLDMIDVAADGHYWMFGHKSEKWFRHDGQEWIPEAPGERLTLLTRTASQSVPDGPVGQYSHDANPYQAQAGNGAVNWSWFFISLMLLLFILVTIYNSAL